MQDYYPLSHQDYCDSLVGRRQLTVHEAEFVMLVIRYIEDDRTDNNSQWFGEPMGEALTPEEFYCGAEWVCNHDERFE